MFTVVLTFCRLTNSSVTVILSNLKAFVWDFGYEILLLVFMLPFFQGHRALINLGGQGYFKFVSISLVTWESLLCMSSSSKRGDSAGVIDA